MLRQDAGSDNANLSSRARKVIPQCTQESTWFSREDAPWCEVNEARLGRNSRLDCQRRNQMRECVVIHPGQTRTLVKHPSRRKIADVSEPTCQATWLLSSSPICRPIRRI